MSKGYLYYLLLTALLVSGCGNMFDKKKTNWDVSLQKDDKKPYGSFLSYQSLKYYFPNAKIEALSSGFRYTSIDGNMYYDTSGPSLLVLSGLDFYVSTAELDELIAFAGYGNEVMLFCSRMDDKIEAKLHCYKYVEGYEQDKLTAYNNGKENIGILKLVSGNNTYGYQGRSLQGYFQTSIDDTAIIDSIKISVPQEEDDDENYEISGPDTLGFAGERPNFVRYKVGEGHITLHGAPLVLSNYFLLQEPNKDYLQGVWETLPDGIAHIYWNDYYKHRADGSSLGVLWRYPSTRWALIIAIVTLLCYVAFEIKRRQRIIPIITPTENSSVSFVETVGRLYYNKGNHDNIAAKMIQHFLEWVRAHHQLNTNIIDAEFVAHLARKTQKTEEEVNKLVEMIHNIRLGSVKVDEPYLYELYNTIQSFYKNEHP